jgi:hypothetical protein
MLSGISQVQKDKGHMFSLVWKIDTKDKCTQRQTSSNTISYVECVCNSGTTLWNLGKEGKEKTECQQYCKT